MRIDRAGPSSAAPADYFTGVVRQTARHDAPEPARVRTVTVTFEPGARTAWHTHPLGQTLVVTDGEGWVCRDGGRKETVRAGDVVWFEPGERHWHGATSRTAMTHVAIQEALDGVAVEWAEPVEDAGYAGGADDVEDADDAE